MHVGGVLLGTTDARTLMACGLVVSNAALLVALVFLRRLVERELDAPTARRAVLYLLVFPSTLFLSSVYPHALFLAAAIPSIDYARRGRWWWAGALGGLAALTRTDGALLLLPLGFEYVRVHRLRWRSDVLGLGLVPLGSALFAAYVYAKLGDPLLMFSAAKEWHRQLSPPWVAFWPYLTQPMGGHGSIVSPLDLVMALLLCALVALTWSRLRPVYAVYATGFLLALLSTGLLASTMRYGLEVFPVFMVLAISGRYRVFDAAYVILAGGTALRLFAAFAQGDWVA